MLLAISVFTLQIALQTENKSGLIEISIETSYRTLIKSHWSK